MTLIPLHAPNDHAKLARLTASIRRHGWQGAPLVRWDEQLVTGAHRLAAARAAGLSDDDIPTIDLPDLFRAAGLDWDTELEERRTPGASVYTDLVALVAALPAEVLERYGIDVE